MYGNMWFSAARATGVRSPPIRFPPLSTFVASTLPRADIRGVCDSLPWLCENDEQLKRCIRKYEGCVYSRARAQVMQISIEELGLEITLKLRRRRYEKVINQVSTYLLWGFFGILRPRRGKLEPEVRRVCLQAARDLIGNTTGMPGQRFRGCYSARWDPAVGRIQSWLRLSGAHRSQLLFHNRALCLVLASIESLVPLSMDATCRRSIRQVTVLSRVSAPHLTVHITGISLCLSP